MSGEAPRRAGDRTPVILLTGFLGSGKTSLLNRALRAPEMANTVVVINEFGEVGLDHLLSAASDDAVIVLENGCLCCTVRSDLVGTMSRLVQDRATGRIPAFDRVVIETSGLAEPGPVLQAFLSEPTMDGSYRVVRVVALVDAVNGLGTIDNHDEAVRQIALADLLVLTKLDLLAADEVAPREAALRALLHRINPAARIARIDDAALSLNEIFSPAGFDPGSTGADPRPWLNLAAYEQAANEPVCADAACDDPTHHHEHHGAPHAHGFGEAHHSRLIESFCLIRDVPLTRGQLQFLLDGITQNLGPSLLRVKGLVNIAEEPGRPAVIQGAQHILHTMTWLDHWPDADQRTRVVFITHGVAKQRLQELIELLDRVAARTAKAKRAVEGRG